jgi:EAL domain-containing protein (putative c-di-GMP-specific phosphodiesterase class I)/ActR/RegA family two-component response regulator
MMSAARILVIDDEADIGEFVAAVAHESGFHCVATTDASAVSELYTPDTALILLDLMMPDMDGIEVLRVLSNLQCKASILLMSGINVRVMETAEKLAHALGLSIAGHLVKPFRLAELEDALRKHAAQEALAAVEHNPRIVFPDDKLRGAVAHDEFVLHYQPQIDLDTGNVIGVEALARWQPPDSSLIYPDNFIARAEALGLIDDLGWLVAERGLSDLKQFADASHAAPRLALNVSVHSLRDLTFPDTLASMLKTHGVPAEGVMVEITESGLIDELSRSLDVLTRLRMKSIHLSIDDFGTGYAMMQQLVAIPATELKIDKIFVLNMHMNSSDRVMAQKTIEIGHELGMKVTAEGVETREQLDFLRLKGCDSAQGYFFSRPLPAPELVLWLEEYRARQIN